MADLFTFCGEEEEKENSGVAENSVNRKLTDADKVDLLNELNNRPCLWKSSGNWKRKDKSDALEEMCERFNLTHDGFKKVVHSLRTSMIREVKRCQEQQNHVSSWKFYQHMKFLQDEIIKSLQQEPEWTEDETTTVIDFYKENPVLWNHCLAEYKDRNLKKLALDKLKACLKDHSEDEIKIYWHSLKTVFDRENKRQQASKKTDSGASDIYKSNWKYFDLLIFTKDCADVDDSQSTMSLVSGTPEGDDEPPFKINKRQKGKTQREMESIRFELYRSAIEALKTSCNNTESSATINLSEEETFGRTVANALVRFNARQKAIARKKISDVLFEVEMGAMENMQPSSAIPGFSVVYSPPHYQQNVISSKQPNLQQTFSSTQFPFNQPEQSPSHYTF